MLLAEEVGGSEVLKQWPHSSSTQFQAGMWLWWQADSTAAAVAMGQSLLPAVSGLMAIKFLQVPFALVPGGKGQEMSWKFVSVARFCAVSPRDL